jgi:hypothetical protein
VRPWQYRNFFIDINPDYVIMAMRSRQVGPIELGRAKWRSRSFQVLGIATIDRAAATFSMAMAAAASAGRSGG